MSSPPPQARAGPPALLSSLLISSLLTGNAILAANPDWLVVVEGVDWGSNLFGVQKAGVQLNKKNK
jgi:hypothetical protein